LSEAQEVLPRAFLRNSFAVSSSSLRLRLILLSSSRVASPASRRRRRRGFAEGKPSKEDKAIQEKALDTA
jgi:hypothetical protein